MACSDKDYVKYTHIHFVIFCNRKIIGFGRIVLMIRRVWFHDTWKINSIQCKMHDTADIHTEPISLETMCDSFEMNKTRNFIRLKYSLRNVHARSVSDNRVNRIEKQAENHLPPFLVCRRSYFNNNCCSNIHIGCITLRAVVRPIFYLHSAHITSNITWKKQKRNKKESTRTSQSHLWSHCRSLSLSFVVIF